MTWDLRHGHYETALADVPTWDTTIIDAPYSERTHSGHADGTVWADSLTEEKKWRRPCDGLLVPLRKRGQLTYGYWTSDDVYACVRWTSPRTRGWYVTITDEHLAPAWIDRVTRRRMHPGNLKYAWTLRARDRRHLPASLPYVKARDLVKLSDLARAA